MFDPVGYFHENTMPEPNSGCLFWIDPRTGSVKDYPWSRKLGGRITRWVVATINCEDVTGKMACHRCDTPCCVSPGHLYAGTSQQNVDDAKRRGTFWECHRASKERFASLTPEQREAELEKLRSAVVRTWGDTTSEDRLVRTAPAREAAAKSRAVMSSEQLLADSSRRSAQWSRFRDSLTPEEYSKWLEDRNSKISTAKRKKSIANVSPEL